MQKRKLESKKIDKKQAKEARRAEREAKKAERQELVDAGLDPDLDGITPGPQALPFDEHGHV